MAAIGVVIAIAVRSRESLGCPVRNNRDIIMLRRHESLGYHNSAPEIENMWRKKQAILYLE